METLVLPCARSGVYKGSLLKAFRKTVEEGRFGFVIVDADNLRADDFKPYWDAGQVRASSRHLDMLQRLGVLDRNGFFCLCNMLCMVAHACRLRAQ